MVIYENMTAFLKLAINPRGKQNSEAVMPTLLLLAGDLRFCASFPILPLWYINLPLFTSTVNIEYLVKNKTDLVWDLAHF